jgi:GDP-L-fucose synthase
VKTVLVTGSNGLVGSALQRLAPSYPQYRWVFSSRSDTNLYNSMEVGDLFNNSCRPNYVIHLAASVGGVNFHAQSPADIFITNCQINNNVIESSALYRVEKLLAFSSICAYPDNIPLLSEDLMHMGEPSPYNEAYAYSKRMIDVLMRACEKQYGLKNWCTVVPVNIAGINDDYNLDNGHVIPCLIHRFWLSINKGQPLKVYGDGSPMREFVDSDDLAKICIELLGISEVPKRLIISSGVEYSIHTVVTMLQEITGYKGQAIWGNGPNGQLRRPTNNGLMKSLGLKTETSLYVTLKKSWDWFCNNYEKARK